LRPLLLSRSLNLIFENASSVPDFFTDEGKVSQIMRNLISNALKFTERGEVRVSAVLKEDEDMIELSVADTGIGIAPEHRDAVFQEFTQIDNAFQRNVKGTGLGLPLSKKLIELLGGTITLRSELGIGSRFTVTLPRRYKSAEETIPKNREVDPGRSLVLVLEQDEETLQIYEAYLKSSPYQAIVARSVEQARKLLQEYRPTAMIVDVPAGAEEYWNFLSELRHQTASRPIVVGLAEDRQQAIALGFDRYAVKPVPGDWLLEQLRKVTGRNDKTVLLIDDEDIARYLVRQSLSGVKLNFIEAMTGEKGLQMAIDKQPDLIFLDLGLPGMSGQQVLSFPKRILAGNRRVRSSRLSS
jgi:DNA-binding response OmpR family regulator/anti-sigma regulatory factor (Ser/Thr protein kinase)